MATTVLSEHLWPDTGVNQMLKRVALVVVGILALGIAAKIKVPVPGTPVMISLGTFAVLSIGAAYGPRLGLVTILGYMLVGALGLDVFQNSSAEKYGLTYMMGTTGGYLVGYVVATLALGWAARRGLDRSVIGMGLAMLLGNVLIYVPGLAWLYVLIDGGMFNADKFASPIDQTLQWGLLPFLVADAVKLALAALLFPVLWKLVGDARA